MSSPIKLIECPRDAMQGLHDFVPTALKAKYINQLLKVGFDTLDFGSFVSAKAIPQLRDTAAVLNMLDLTNSRSRLLAIVANTRGAVDAMNFPEISYLGFPFSISETFQQRNTNSSIADAIVAVEQLLELCDKNNKEAVIYLSMGFGNPYGDDWSPELVEKWTDILVAKGVKTLSIADTTGVSTTEKIETVLAPLIKRFNTVEIGVHLHSTPAVSIEKIEAAYLTGCRRFDSAILGFGGCPMAADDLTGNIATEDLLNVLEQKNEQLNLNLAALSEAQITANQIFLS